MTRTRIAVASLTAGVACGPTGVFLGFGLAWALIVLSVLLIGLALLVGWDA